MVEGRAREEYALVHEASLREELDDGCLTTFEASLGLAISCTRLLTLVTTTRGLTKTRAATATKSFLLDTT